MHCSGCGKDKRIFYGDIELKTPRLIEEFEMRQRIEPNWGIEHDDHVKMPPKRKRLVRINPVTDWYEVVDHGQTRRPEGSTDNSNTDSS